MVGYQAFDPLVHKEVYTVGVQASGGVDTAWREFNLTFAEFLSATAGRRFQPPISFEMEPSDAPMHDW